MELLSAIVFVTEGKPLLARLLLLPIQRWLLAIAGDLLCRDRINTP